MPRYRITLCNIDSDRLCTADVIVEAENLEAAEFHAVSRPHEFEWSDDRGEPVDWNEVGGQIVVADGTTKIRD